MEGRRHIDTRTWSIADRLALVWSICLHQQAIPRDLNENWLHCWLRQCQRTYLKHNIGKHPQLVLSFLLIAQETVAINLMVLRDPGILQNRETHVTGPPSVVTLSIMQDQRQVSQIRRPWAHAYDPWIALSWPNAPAKPEDTPRSHEASANQLRKTSWLPSGRKDPYTSSTLQCNRAATEFRGVVENPCLGAGTLRWAKKLLQLGFWALTGCTGKPWPPMSLWIAWSSRPLKSTAAGHITDAKWRSRLPVKAKYCSSAASGSIWCSRRTWFAHTVLLLNAELHTKQ